MLRLYGSTVALPQQQIAQYLTLHGESSPPLEADCVGAPAEKAAVRRM